MVHLHIGEVRLGLTAFFGKEHRRGGYQGYQPAYDSFHDMTSLIHYYI
jgi:hypothetical protein